MSPPPTVEFNYWLYLLQRFLFNARISIANHYDMKDIDLIEASGTTTYLSMKQRLDEWLKEFKKSFSICYQWVF